MRWEACPSLAKVLLLSLLTYYGKPVLTGHAYRGGGSCKKGGGPAACSLGQVFCFAQRIMRTRLLC